MEGGRTRGKETWMCERNINRLPLARPQLGAWPTIPTCSGTGNRTSGLPVCRPTLRAFRRHKKPPKVRESQALPIQIVVILHELLRRNKFWQIWCLWPPLTGKLIFLLICFLQIDPDFDNPLLPVRRSHIGCHVGFQGMHFGKHGSSLFFTLVGERKGMRGSPREMAAALVQAAC